MDKLESERDLGLCFHRSAALCFDLPHSLLVVGTLAGVTEADNAPEWASREPFIHCWVEWSGKVFAPTTIEHFGRLQAMDKTGYYNINGATNISRIPRSKLLQIFKREPRLLLELQLGLAPEKVGLLVDSICKAAKVAVRYNKDGGVLPA